MKNLFHRIIDHISPSTLYGIRCEQRRRFRMSPEELEPRQLMTVTPGNGAVLSHVEVQALFVGNDWSTNSTENNQAGQLNGFLQYIVNSPYMDMLNEAGYGVGRGSETNGIILNANINKAYQLTDATIHQDIESALRGGSYALAAPDANRLYVVYVEQGVQINNGSGNSLHDFAGYHSSFAGTDAFGRSAQIRYAVIAYPGGVNMVASGYSDFQFMTSVTSHELAEAVTDPDPGSGWYDHQLGLDRGEIGDIVAWQRTTLNGYTVQKESDKNDNPMDPNNVLQAPVLHGSATSSSTASLNWNAVSGAQGYRVQWWNASTGQWVTIGNLNSSTTGTPINSLSPNSTSYFRIEAFNGSQVADSAWISITTPR